MRLLVFFDLPTKTKKQRKSHNDFRKLLLRNGFTRLQLSVYGRVCKGLDGTKAQIEKIKRYLPPEGNIRAMKVTEKQYAGMDILIGSKKKEEEKAGDQLMLL